MQLSEKNSIVIFCIGYFLLCYGFAITWYNTGYFGVFDIFFEADPNTNLFSFSHGNSFARHAISHAFLELPAVPIRIIENILSSLGIISDERRFREILGLIISPLISTLTVLCFYNILKLLKVEPIDVKIFTLIFAFSFSNLLFAILPETYPISCFLISLLIYYYLLCRNDGAKSKPIIWLSLAILLAGITITNVCIFFIVFAVYLLKAEKLNYWNCFKQASLYSIAAVVLVVAFYLVTHFLLDLKQGSEGRPDWILLYTSSSLQQVAVNAVNLLGASVNAFVGVFPSTSPRGYCKVVETCNNISFIRSKTDFLWLLFVVIFISFTIFKTIKHIQDKRWYDLHLLILLIISFNFALHIIFGLEMFLYTQHWMAPLMLLFVPLLAEKRALSLSVLALLIIININFILTVDQLIGFS